MVTFQHKLSAGLRQRGINVVYSLDDKPYTAVLIVGGTRQLAKLRRARQQGVRIIQRLDGMNWLHRQRRTGLRHYLRSEYGNFLLGLIRSRLVDHIVYQSVFSQQWWERERGPAPVSCSIVHNGVDLDIFAPSGPHQRPEDCERLLLVEGSLMGGYEAGLEIALELASALAKKRSAPIELSIVGQVQTQQKAHWQNQSPVSIDWTGRVTHERIPEIDRSAHLLYSADVNPACPNAVIEAMACGLPVLAFDTGALPELVVGDAGRLVSYGGNPWKLEPPDVPALVEAAADILSSQERFRKAARMRAEAAFGLDRMVNGYLNALLES